MCCLTTRSAALLSRWVFAGSCLYVDNHRNCVHAEDAVAAVLTKHAPRHTKHTQEYASDNAAFQRDFAAAYQKLVLTGAAWRSV